MNMIDISHSPARDYATVRKMLAFITENWREQPSLETIAEEAGLSPHHLQRVFTRWAGLSPKAFLQAVTLDHARGLLRDSASILDASYELGLSGPGRLHDLFVTHEGMSPGIYKAHGRGLNISYGFHDCPFGRALILITSEGLAGLAFADIGKPKAARAVGSAVGKNPISFVVPCHRVLEKSGGLGGYHWGLTRKRAILGWEAGAMAA